MKETYRLQNQSKRSTGIDFILGVLILLMLSLSSCITHKQLVILNEGDETDLDSLSQILNFPEHIIQTDDRLFISVKAFDEETATPFSLERPNAGGGGGGMNMLNPESISINPFIGHLVDEDGNIEFPVLGTIKLGGLTIEEAKLVMYNLLDNYLVNYSVDMNFLNRRVVVLGEVLEPGRISLQRNRTTILEAIQDAGGITAYSNTKNITVIREIDGKRLVGNVDIDNLDVLESDFFYTMPNDIIYIQPVKAKTFSAQTSVWTTANIASIIVGSLGFFLALSQ